MSIKSARIFIHFQFHFKISINSIFQVFFSFNQPFDKLLAHSTSSELSFLLRTGQAGEYADQPGAADMRKLQVISWHCAAVSLTSPSC